MLFPISPMFLSRDFPIIRDRCSSKHVRQIDFNVLICYFTKVILYYS